MKEKKSIKITVTTFIWVLVIAIVIAIVSTCIIMTNFITSKSENLGNKDVTNTVLEESNLISNETEEKTAEQENIVENYDDSEFELTFLKLENKKIIVK